MRKVREAFEPQVEVDGGGLFVLFFYEMAGFRQASFLQPLAGGHVECLLKVALEGGKASAGELGKSFNGDIEMKIAEHELFEIDLVRFRKVEKEFFECGQDMQQ